jgi:hypothetical protein
MKSPLTVLALLPAVASMACTSCQSKPSEQASDPAPSESAVETTTAPKPSTDPSSESSATAAADLPEAASAEVEPAPSPSSKPTVAPAPADTAKTSTAPKPAPPSAPKGYSGDDPCTQKTFKTAQLRAACSSGGRPAAKAFMKNIVNKAKAQGENLKCSACHSSVKTFDQKPNALSDLRTWL